MQSCSPAFLRWRQSCGLISQWSWYARRIPCSPCPQEDRQENLRNSGVTKASKPGDCSKSSTVAVCHTISVICHLPFDDFQIEWTASSAHLTKRRPIPWSKVEFLETMTRLKFAKQCTIGPLYKRKEARLHQVLDSPFSLTTTYKYIISRRVHAC